MPRSSAALRLSPPLQIRGSMQAGPAKAAQGRTSQRSSLRLAPGFRAGLHIQHRSALQHPALQGRLGCCRRNVLIAPAAPPGCQHGVRFARPMRCSLQQRLAVSAASVWQEVRMCQSSKTTHADSQSTILLPA